MTEILTESFCERCGTRYTFEPTESRRGPLKGIGTLGRGIRHFVTDSGTTLDEAFAVARSEAEQRTTAHALEAFHQTFNFCLSCRQYTCGECWNAVEGRCLTCAPTPESLAEPARTEAVIVPVDLAAPVADLAAPIADLAAAPAVLAVAPVEPAAAAVEPLAAIELAAPAPVADVEAPVADVEAAPELAASPETEAAPADPESDIRSLEPEPSVEDMLDLPTLDEATLLERLEPTGRPAVGTVESGDAAPLDAEEAEVPAAEDGADDGADPEAAALAFEPGINLDAEIAEYERRMASDAIEPSVEALESVSPAEAVTAPAVEAAEPEAQVVAETEIEPVAQIEVEPEAEVVAETEVEPEAEIEPEAEAIAPAIEPSPEPAVASDAEDEPEADVWAAFRPKSGVWAPSADAVDELQVAASASSPQAADPTPIEAGPAAWPEPDRVVAAFETSWPDGSPSVVAPTAAAADPVAQTTLAAAPLAGGARACPSCGLSLSASARFCRRCGTPQQAAS